MRRSWKVLSIRWCGVASDQYAAMRDFAVQTLGLEVRHEEEDFVVADAANGDRFEVFGPSAKRPPWQFGDSPIMIGFLVDDIDAARHDVAAAVGVELLGPLQGEGSMKWQHFRAPNGVVFELTWDERAVGNE